METCSGIKVHYLNTFFVATRLSKIRPSLWFPRPQKYVKSALKFLGTSSIVITPYFWHFVIEWIGILIPESVRMNLMYEMNLSIRSRAIAKLKK